MAREIIETVERRRKWPDEVKLRIMSEALVPGASTCAVADRNGVCRSLLYMWLRLAREGRLPGILLNASKPASPSAMFVPVTVQPPNDVPAAAAVPRAMRASKLPNAHTASVPSAAQRRAASIEVRLANGRTLKVDEGIDPDVLARLAAALEEAAA